MNQNIWNRTEIEPTFTSNSSSYISFSGSGSGARRFLAGAWSVMTGMGLPAPPDENRSDSDMGARRLTATLAVAETCVTPTDGVRVDGCGANRLVADRPGEDSLEEIGALSVWSWMREKADCTGRLAGNAETEAPGEALNLGWGWGAVCCSLASGAAAKTFFTVL